MGKLTGKMALVTGADSGIGLATPARAITRSLPTVWTPPS